MPNSIRETPCSEESAAGADGRREVLARGGGQRVRRRIPRRLLLELADSLARGERRSVLADAERMVQALQPPPLVLGRENVPAVGGFTIVANHYQRRDLWIGWGGSLLVHACGRDLHWLVLRELRLRGLELPLSRQLLTRVSRAYGFVPVPADLTDHCGQAAAIRQALRRLGQHQAIGFFPEGEHGQSRRLSAAVPGAAKLAVLLSRYAPLLPAAIWEEGPRLACAFGRPFRLDAPDPEALMAPIAGLLRTH